MLLHFLQKLNHVQPFRMCFSSLFLLLGNGRLTAAWVVFRSLIFWSSSGRDSFLKLTTYEGGRHTASVGTVGGVVAPCDHGHDETLEDLELDATSVRPLVHFACIEDDEVAVLEEEETDQRVSHEHGHPSL